MLLTVPVLPALACVKSASDVSRTLLYSHRSSQDVGGAIVCALLFVPTKNISVALALAVVIAVTLAACELPELPLEVASLGVVVSTPL